MVNAPVVARERDISVTEVKTEGPTDYQTLIRLTVRTERRGRRVVADDRSRQERSGPLEQHTRVRERRSEPTARHVLCLHREAGVDRDNAMRHAQRRGARPRVCERERERARDRERQQQAQRAAW